MAEGWDLIAHFLLKAQLDHLVKQKVRGLLMLLLLFFHSKSLAEITCCNNSEEELTCQSAILEERRTIETWKKHEGKIIQQI